MVDFAFDGFIQFETRWIRFNFPWIIFQKRSFIQEASASIWLWNLSFFTEQQRTILTIYQKLLEITKNIILFRIIFFPGLFFSEKIDIFSPVFVFEQMWLDDRNAKRCLDSNFWLMKNKLIEKKNELLWIKSIFC